MNKINPIIKEFSAPYKREITKILNVIKKYDRIAIFRHTAPDYDALGSQYGLATWIKDNFPNKEVRCLGENHVTFTPRIFPESDSLNQDWFTTPFLGIIVDTSNKSRISDPRWKKAKYKVKIDHHPEVEKFGKASIVNTNGAAAAENIVGVLMNMKGDYVLSKEAARYFYIGIAGDSGRFQYSSTSQHTFAIAGELLKTGINISKIYQEMYLKQIDDLYVTAYVLGHFKISEHGVAYYVLDKKTQEDLKITTERGKENVNLFANIEGVNAWCSVTEDPKDHCWRISIRSKETPINDVAAKWEGGGHAQASGAKIDNLNQLKDFINDLDVLFK